MTSPRTAPQVTHASPAQALQEIVRRPELEDLIQRVVVTGTNGVELYVQRPGQAAADAVSYPVFDLPTPLIAGDEAILLRVGSGYIVAGKVIANRL